MARITSIDAESSHPPVGGEYLGNILAAVREQHYPTQIGQYFIEQLIGEGGMGSVFKAEQREPIRRTVAIKVIKLGMDTRQVIARFESERQALAMMDHPNVARVIDAGTTETGRPYFIMEYVDGEPITSFCDRFKYTIRQRLELFTQACDAVQHAHQKAIIHRDLKPSNILVALQDGKPWVKVIDFGVAKALSERLTEKSQFTETGQLMGTPEYMAPEQAEGNSTDVDTRTDVYSLGVVLYEILVGALPFDAPTLRSASYNEMQRIIRDVDPPRPSTRLTKLGESGREIARLRHTQLDLLHRQLKCELEWIPLKAMRKEPTQRYFSPRELSEDVSNYLSNRPLRAGPESKAYRARKFLRRNKPGVAAAVFMFLLLISGVVATSWQAVRAIRAERGTRAALVEVQQQKTTAEEANSSMRAVNQFLTEDVLGSSTPAVTRGKPLSVSEALDSAARTINGRFKDRPAIKSAIHIALASAYREISQTDSAVAHARAALNICTASLKPDDRQLLTAMSELGLSLKDQGKLDEADQLITTSLQRARNTYGSDDELTHELIGSLGALRLSQGQLKEAERLFREELAGARKRFGDEHEQTLRATNNLAHVLRYEGNLPAAESLLRAAVQSARRVLGPDHPDTLTNMNTLGAVLQGLGKLDEAEATKRETVRLARRVFGEEHLSTIVYIGNFADALQQHGKDAEAEPLFREALEKGRRVLGPDHHVTLGITNNFARFLDNHDNWNEAEPLYRDAAELGRKARGIEHPDVIVSILNYARALARHGKLDDAAAQAALVMPVARRKLGDDHRLTRVLMQEYGRILNMQGKTVEAEALLKESLERGHKVLTPNDPDMMSSLRTMADFLMEHQRFADAEPIAAELYRLSGAAQMSPRNVTSNMLLWGLCLHAQGEHARAEAPLREVHRRMSEAGMTGGQEMRAVLTALTSVCEHNGRPDEAAKWRAELATLQTTTQPTSGPTPR